MLPFGTRWNLRDTIRHKSRTAMSLIGIIGCMTIMVGCLGMRDTMDEFLDISFGTATNYASRIFLTEDATEADDAIKSIQSKQMIMDSFDVFTEIMNLMISLMVIVAMILGIVVLYNLGVMSYTERYREMATLKVLGFRDKKIGALLIDQNLWVTLLGILIGIPAGRAALQYLLKKLAGEYEMNMAIYPASYLISIVLTFGVSLLVSIMVSRKNKKKRLDLPTASFSFYPILFCKQSCGQVSVTGIGEQNHDGLALIFGTLCQFYCCMYGCTGRNTD